MTLRAERGTPFVPESGPNGEGFVRGTVAPTPTRFRAPLARVGAEFGAFRHTCPRRLEALVARLRDEPAVVRRVPAAHAGDAGATRGRPELPQLPVRQRRRRVDGVREVAEAVAGQAATSLSDIFGPDLERDGRTYSIAEGTGIASLGVIEIPSQSVLNIYPDKARLSTRFGDQAVSVAITDARTWDFAAGSVDEAGALHGRRGDVAADHPADGAALLPCRVHLRRTPAVGGSRASSWHSRLRTRGST